MIRQSVSSYLRGQKGITPQALSLNGYDKFHLPEGYNLKVCLPVNIEPSIKTLYEGVKGGVRPKSFGF